MIAIGGLGSGLDTNAIIKAMLDVERIPLQQLEARKANEQSKLDLIGTLKGYVQSLQTKAKALATSIDFRDFTVAASRDGVAAFGATGEAEAGSHTLTVNSLAQADRWAFNGVADPDVDLASAEGQLISFSVGTTTYDLTLSQENSSLNEIASQLNGLAGDDITASVVNVGTGSNPSYQLVVAADETGEDYRITGISSTVAGLTIDGTGPDGSGVSQSVNNITVGTNAVAIIDGLQVERSGNEFSDVVTGVSINLEAADPSTEISFTVEADFEAAKAKITEFVDAYNEVMTFINEQSTYDSEEGPGGQLFGDSLLTSVRSQINQALFSVDLATIQADTEGYVTLRNIGIKSTNDGTLEIDADLLDEKMANNIDLLADIFVDSDGFDNGGAEVNTPGYYTDTTADSGFAASLDRMIDRMLKLTDGPLVDGERIVLKGLFDAKTETINATISRFTKQIDARELYLDKYEQELIHRFAALEELMGGLNAQGTSLSAGLASLTNFNN